MEIKKNFFALVSASKSPETASRELDPLSPDTAEFLRQFNQNSIPPFIFNIFVSKLIHLINVKPSYQNRGRVLLTEATKIDYSESKIIAVLKFLFDRDDAGCTVLFLSGHGNSKGEMMLLVKEGEFPISFEIIKNIWDQRTSKEKNRELYIIVDCCYSGQWVLQNTNPDIFIQASCSPKEKARDFVVDNVVLGSVFLHNFLLVNGVAECFYEGAYQTPICTNVSPENSERIKNLLDLNIGMKSWQDFKALFENVQLRSFNRDKVLYVGEMPEHMKKGGNPDVKKWNFTTG